MFDKKKKHLHVVLNTSFNLNRTKPLLVAVTDPSGKVHPEITNKNGNPNYKYFYSSAEQGNDAESQRLPVESLSFDFSSFTLTLKWPPHLLLPVSHFILCDEIKAKCPERTLNQFRVINEVKQSFSHDDVNL